MPLYFAYGSNMDEHAMLARCPRARVLGTARLPRHRFVLMGNGYATVRPHAGVDVHGVAYDLAASDIDPLDRYEDVAGGLYAKVTLAVVQTGQASADAGRQALVYLGTDPTTGRAVHPGYMEGIAAAAAAFALPEAYVAALREMGSPPPWPPCRGGPVVIAPVIAEQATLREHVAAWRGRGLRVALVPTMGALHAGHARLVTEARIVADRVIVSVFVNPTQFAAGEDFETYPRDLGVDRERATEAGADLVYAPGAAAMYPAAFATTVGVGGPAAAGLEDRSRPTHFAGVATVVAKLLMQAAPDIALFGEKDFQQLRVIERIVLDLNIPARVLGVATVRDAHGLALSSRNIHLTPDERSRAPALHAALAAAAAAIERGEPIADSVEAARRRIRTAGFALDYVEGRRADTLAPFAPEEAGAGRILAAARLGATRLIDNVGFAGPHALRPRGKQP